MYAGSAYAAGVVPTRLYGSARRGCHAWSIEYAIRSLDICLPVCAWPTRPVRSLASVTMPAYSTFGSDSHVAFAVLASWNQDAVRGNRLAEVTATTALWDTIGLAVYRHFDAIG